MSSMSWRSLWLFVSVCGATEPALARDLDYRLRAEAVADQVYVFSGAQEHFSRSNGGNIVNTGFICTEDGAVVIDSGPSRLYGTQQRAQILAHCPAGIAQVIITHAHPDHFLGSSAYVEADKGVPILALASTQATIAQLGDSLTENLFHMVGDWMRGTYPVVPSISTGNQTLRVGGRDILLIAMAGHTDGDLAVLDLATGVIFAGDLVFFERTPTTPHADVRLWLDSLAELSRLPIKSLVPGHGPVVHDGRARQQTEAYLHWLGQTLEQAAGRGDDMAELLDQTAPLQLGTLAVFQEEFARSLAHLYAPYEEQALTVRPPLPQAR